MAFPVSDGEGGAAVFTPPPVGMKPCLAVRVTTDGVHSITEGEWVGAGLEFE